MKLWIKSCIGNSNNYYINNIHEACSILQLKKIIANHETFPIKFLSQLRILHSGRDISNNVLCDNCGILDEHTIEVSLRLKAGMPNNVKKKKKKKSKKKKKGGKKKEDNEEKTITDEFNGLNAEELIKIERVLQTKLSEVQKQRSYFQIERETVQKMYDITNGALVKHTTDIKNIESGIQSLRNSHRNNIRMYVQKVKHLNYDQENTLSSINLECEMVSNEQISISAMKKNNLLQQKKKLIDTQVQQKLRNEKEIEELQAKNKQKLKALEEDFENKWSDLKNKLDSEIKELESDLHLQTKLEVHEICERKNMHINDLISAHETVFDEMRTYYNHITRDNLDLIRSLKLELSELALKSAEYDSNIEQIQCENEKLNVPLKKAQKKHASIEKLVCNHSKDKRSLKAKRNRLFQMNTQIEQTSKKYMQLKLQFKGAQLKKESLMQRYKQVCNEQNENANELESNDSVKEEKLESLENEYKNKRLEFEEILKRANMDEVVAEHLTSKLSKIIDEKNADISQLRYERVKLMKATDDLVRVYQQKLLADKYSHIIPIDHIKHIPFLQKENQNCQPSKVPAGFVSGSV